MDATNRWSKVPTYTQSEAEEVPGWCVLPPLPVLLCLVFHGDAVDAVDTDTDDDDDDRSSGSELDLELVSTIALLEQSYV